MCHRLRFTIACILLAAAVRPVSAQTSHATGLVDDPPAVLAAVPRQPAYRAYLPPRSDFTRYFPLVRSQGEQGSCTAWATGYNALSAAFNLQLERQGAAAGERRRVAFSPAYLFNLLHRGRCEGGTSVTAALDAIHDNGLVTFDGLPYDPKACSALPDDLRMRDARSNRLLTYSLIDKDDRDVLEKIRGAVFARKPVVIGIYSGDITSALQRYRGGVFRDVLPKENAHAMVIAGYDDASQTFTVVNSWGERWGEQGLLRIDYQTLLANLSNGPFVIDEIDPDGIRRLLAAAHVEPEPPVPPPAPPVIRQNASPDVLRDAIRRRVDKLQCAHVDAGVAADRSVALTGFVGSQGDLDALLKAVAAMPDAGHVDNRVTVHPWPQCEVYLSFDQGLRHAGGLDVKAVGHPAEHYREGDSLALQVTSPGYPSYLYVAYLQASGEVVYLSWPEGASPRPVPPRSRLVFGGGRNGQPVYRVAKPFGDEIVVVIASRRRLVAGALPDREVDREFLTKFRMPLLDPDSASARDAVAVAVLPLKTVAKE
ncbi:C1 family peptidase [Burkholderia sp. BCC1644]|uniref:C1 family peptidase n=1 Tax=Burkholderia sp. BCC1644 TaxID=2676293 RepID=UPI0015912558|nr:C1 family peptidase [Burkholderia sp. BCC1644]